MEKIEHLGIAVRNLQDAIPLWEQLLQTTCYKKETITSENVETAFFKTGDSKIELLQSLTPDGIIAKFIEKNGEGMHHVAFAVPDILLAIEQKKREGFRVLNESPKKGADNKLVVFIHPKSSNGVLIELCQEIH